MDQQPCFMETQVNKVVQTPNTYADVHCYSKSGYEFKTKPMVNQSNPFKKELLVSNDSNRNECAHAQPYDTNTCHTLKELQQVEKKQKVIELEASSDLMSKSFLWSKPKESNSADYQLKQNSKDSQHNIFPEMKSKHEIIDLESPDLHEQKYFMEHKVNNSTDCETRINSGLFPEEKIKKEIIDHESLDLEGYFMDCKESNSANYHLKQNSKDSQHNIFPEMKKVEIKQEPPNFDEQEHFMGQPKESNSAETSNTHAATNSRSDCQGSRFQQELITPEYSSHPVML
ncbi:hypothetical protein CEXT_592381 [Caerostris extrusa]|uniref:Uncharacterized protein n=1 Tax=Caerostris extrusa TaxID=172846 RepID=A0AAV4UV42_CAEEX|nr:hypothetical protein CEXT_592381 [Caerostris extrusa]